MSSDRIRWDVQRNLCARGLAIDPRPLRTVSQAVHDRIMQAHRDKAPQAAMAARGQAA
jgi:hypothetical protein